MGHLQLPGFVVSIPGARCQRAGSRHPTRPKAFMKRLCVLCVAILASTFVFADGPPGSSVAGSPNTAIGYKTVAQALASLRQMKGASFSVVRGWTIVTDESNLTVWSFAPKTDPSYPAVVKRMVSSTGTGSKVTMDVLCEASKTACNNLVREFSNTKSRGPGAPAAAR